MLYTYDRSPSLSIALIANGKMGGACYVPLKDAPDFMPDRIVDRVYLRQLHAIACSEMVGLTVRERMQFDSAQWERMRD